MLESSASRILVVDDDAGIRDVLGDYLSQHGFVAYQAGAASEMDEVLASTPVDLIVLDMMMPGEDGLSVCRRMSGKGALILMLSAMSEETDRIVGLQLGAKQASQIYVFPTKKSVSEVENGGEWHVGAGAGITVVNANATANVETGKPRVYVFDSTGLNGGAKVSTLRICKDGDNS